MQTGTAMRTEQNIWHFQLQPVYQYVNSPYIIHKKNPNCLVMRIKQMIIHSNLGKTKNKIFVADRVSLVLCRDHISKISQPVHTRKL